MLENHNIYDANNDKDHDETECIRVAVFTYDLNLREVEPVIVQVTFVVLRKKSLLFLAAYARIYKSLANSVVLNNKKSYWEKPSAIDELSTFSNDLTKIVRVIITTVKCIKWRGKDVQVTVLDKGHKQITGRSLR